MDAQAFGRQRRQRGKTLGIVSPQLQEVQNALGRPYLVENPSSYVGFGASTMTETEFLCELVRRTECLLLCDVSNVYLSAHNMGYDPYRYIDELPSSAIRELHLGGFTPEDDEGVPGRPLLIDTHAAVITERVWDLYAYAVRRFGPVPTLIEWDNDLPPFAVLMGEAARADAVRTASQSEPHTHAVAS